MDLKHWKLEVDADNLAWLWFDRAGSATNTFSTQALEELGRIADHLAAMPPRARLLSAKGTLRAGADIDEFTTISSAERRWRSPRWARRLRQDRGVPHPDARHDPRLLHGRRHGAGARVPVRSPTTARRLAWRCGGMIGIVPGWAGQGMPALSARQRARLMSPAAASTAPREKLPSGRRDAKRHFDIAVRMFLASRRRAQAAVRRGRHRLAVVRSLWRGCRVEVAEKARPGPLSPRPTRSSTVEDSRGGGTCHRPPARGRASHPTTRNLIRLFKLQDRMKALGKSGIAPIRHLHVIGAGAMGGDIAAWCALKGIAVTLQDLAPERIAPAIQRAHALFKKRLKQPHLVQAAFDRLIPDVSGNGVAKADLVIEAIVENAEIKRKLFAGIEPRMKGGAILASKHVEHPAAELSGGPPAPERLVGLHFFNPVAMMMLVEIVEGPQTPPR